MADPTAPVPDRLSAPAPTAEGRLEAFCVVVLRMLRSGSEGGTLLPAVAATFARAIGEGARETESELRGEIRTWDEAAGRLRELAGSRFAGVGPEVGLLLDKLDRARAEAARVADLLEALRGGGDPPPPLSPAPPVTTTRGVRNRPAPVANHLTETAQTRAVTEVETPVSSAVARPGPPVPPRVQTREPEPPPKPVAPVLPLRPPTRDAKPPPKPVARAAPQLALQCPGCGTTGSIRWDKLQLGRVLACPTCARVFTCGRSGHVVEVVRDRSGRWVERQSRDAELRRRRANRVRILAAAAVAIAVLSAGVTGARVLGRAVAKSDELPRDLKVRADLFARAWASGDYPLMRRLTDPVQDRQLFAWYRRNPPSPGTAVADKALDLESVPSQPPKAVFRVRGQVAGRGARPTDLILTWEERGGNWMFQPGPQAQTKTGK